MAGGAVGKVVASFHQHLALERALVAGQVGDAGLLVGQPVDRLRTSRRVDGHPSPGLVKEADGAFQLMGKSLRLLTEPFQGLMGRQARIAEGLQALLQGRKGQGVIQALALPVADAQIDQGAFAFSQRKEVQPIPLGVDQGLMQPGHFETALAGLTQAALTEVGFGGLVSLGQLGFDESLIALQAGVAITALHHPASGGIEAGPTARTEKCAKLELHGAAFCFCQGQPCAGPGGRRQEEAKSPK